MIVVVERKKRTPAFIRLVLVQQDDRLAQGTDGQRVAAIAAPGETDACGAIRRTGRHDDVLVGGRAGLDAGGFLDGGLGFGDALDVGPEDAEAFFHLFVAAIKVIDAADGGCAFGGEASEDQACGGAEV